MSPYAHITGWGTSVPEKILTNEELAKTVDTDEAGIVDRTGIASAISPHLKTRLLRWRQRLPYRH